MAKRSPMQKAVEDARAWSEEAQKVYVCDFCATELPDVFTTWRTREAFTSVIAQLDADNRVEDSAELGFDEEWGACPSCSKVVALRDPRKLVAYVMKARHERVGKIEHPREVSAHLFDLFRGFFSLNPQPELGVRPGVVLGSALERFPDMGGARPLDADARDNAGRQILGGEKHGRQ